MAEARLLHRFVAVVETAAAATATPITGGACAGFALVWLSD
jgi:hypothetical protein